MMRLGLVAMPFSSSLLPSIQVGLLTTMGKEAHWETDVHYFNLQFAHKIGWSEYETICNQRFRLLGEWLFSVSAFGDSAPDDEEFLNQCNLSEIEEALGFSKTDLIDWRHNRVPQFIDTLARNDCWLKTDVVGYTSMFEQTCAALALARAVKDKYPSIINVFGGANFDGSMGCEFLHKLDFLDYVVAGEAESAFPRLLHSIAQQREIRFDGVHSKKGPEPTVSRTPLLKEMDQAPIPDYDDYFMQLARLGAPRGINGRKVFVPFESARGCWWGETSHCTFCGLNALGMAYRSKTPERVLSELDMLSTRYGRHPFFAVDNILDHRYIEDVFGSLEERELDYEFWYELKANLKPDQIRSLSKGGLTWAQPGIETMNTNVLKLMRKGSSSFINLRFLKWATYYRIRVAWNVLYGFPGETEEDYQSLSTLFKTISHLPPPDDCGSIRMDRFSPYHRRPEEWGLTNVRPDPRYAAIYPELIEASEIAYYFEFDQPEHLAKETYETVHDNVDHWREKWSNGSQPSLNYTRSASQIRFYDTRFDEPRNAYFGQLASDIYPIIGRTHRSVGQLMDKLKSAGRHVSASEIDAVLEDLAEHKLIWREGDLMFGLGLPSNARY